MPLAGSLDLFILMVDYVAGGILFSLILWAIILLITGILGRMSMNSIIVILATYAVTVSVGYVGALLVVPLFTFALWYALSGVVNYINQIR